MIGEVKPILLVSFNCSEPPATPFFTALQLHFIAACLINELCSITIFCDSEWTTKECIAYLLLTFGYYIAALHNAGKCVRLGIFQVMVIPDAALLDDITFRVKLTVRPLAGSGCHN